MDAQMIAVLIAGGGGLVIFGGPRNWRALLDEVVEALARGGGGVLRPWWPVIRAVGWALRQRSGHRAGKWTPPGRASRWRGHRRGWPSSALDLGVGRRACAPAGGRLI